MPIVSVSNKAIPKEYNDGPKSRHFGNEIRHLTHLFYCAILEESGDSVVARFRAEFDLEATISASAVAER